MSAVFKQHLQKFTGISSVEYDHIRSFFTQQQVGKKENLMCEGQLCRYNYFVEKGCLRKFFINEKGGEQTTEFAIENWWITDNLAYEKETRTEFFIQAVEKSDVLLIDYTSQEKLLQEFPALERYFRFVYQRAYAAAQMRIRYLYGLSREELYHHFAERHPYFINRIPQYLVASFLGFTPEYLSELRKKSLPGKNH